MSIDVMNLVWRSTLEGSSKRFVLLALADRADDDGYCWPGVQNLVEKTGLSERTVQRALKDLEADQLLLHEARWTPQGDRDTNAYWINTEALAAIQRPRVSERGKHPMALARRPPDGWCHGVTTSRHSEPTGGVMVTPNTSVKTAGSPQEEALTRLERSAVAPSTQASTDEVDHDGWLRAGFPGPMPPPSYHDEPDEWIDYKAGGLESNERNCMQSMLDDGQEPKKILNTILKQRDGIYAGDRSAIRGKWLPFVKRKVGGWRRGEYDYARKLLADYHPDIVVEELLCQRAAQSAA